MKCRQYIMTSVLVSLFFSMLLYSLPGHAATIGLYTWDEEWFDFDVDGAFETTFGPVFRVDNWSDTTLFGGSFSNILVNLSTDSGMQTISLLDANAGLYVESTDDLSSIPITMAQLQFNFSPAGLLTAVINQNELQEIYNDGFYSILSASVLLEYTPSEGPAAPIPEPSTLLLIGCGLAGLMCWFQISRKRGVEI